MSYLLFVIGLKVSTALNQASTSLSAAEVSNCYVISGSTPYLT